MESIEELGRKYLAEADRLDAEAERLKKNRPKGNGADAATWRRQIHTLESMAVESRITGNQLVGYYEKEEKR